MLRRVIEWFDGERWDGTCWDLCDGGVVVARYLRAMRERGKRVDGKGAKDAR